MNILAQTFSSYLIDVGLNVFLQIASCQLQSTNPNFAIIRTSGTATLSMTGANLTNNETTPTAPLLYLASAPPAPATHTLGTTSLLIPAGVGSTSPPAIIMDATGQSLSSLIVPLMYDRMHLLLIQLVPLLI